MAQEKQEKKPEAKRFYEPKCSPMRDVCEWQTDNDGHHIYVKVGEKNFDDEIQLYKDSCDIKILVDKLLKGDSQTILQLSQPMSYGDVNNFPQECHPAALDDSLKQFYESQPDSIKAKYPRYEDFKNYFLSVTDATIKTLADAEEAAKKKADEDKAAAELAKAQAALDVQAAAIAKAIGGNK